jgi:hypothetical protein
MFSRYGQRKSPPRPAAEIAAEKAEKDRQAKTCQICARRIFAESGVIAHHGYERPGEGWQTASCPGARRLPFEVEKTVLEDHVAGQKDRLERITAARAAVAAETAPVQFCYSLRVARSSDCPSGRKPMRHELTRENFEAVKAEHAANFRTYSMYQFEDAMASDLRQRDGEIKRTTDYITYQEHRMKDWETSFRKGGFNEPVWVKL